MDFAAHIGSDSDSHSESESSEKFSSYTSDTEYEGEVHLGWNCDDFNEFVNNKHWKNYCDTQFYTTILQIEDRRVKDEKVVHNLVLHHKHSVEKKLTWEKYYCDSEYTDIGAKFFTGLFCKPTNCYVLL